VTIVVEGVSVAYGPVVAVDDVTCTFDDGTATALVGPNGSGKTTLLHLLAGLEMPARGRVVPPPAPGSVAYVPQQPGRGHWIPLTAGEVVAMGRYGRRGLLARLRGDDHRRIAMAAERLEVAGVLDRQYGNLSGGLRQRVLVAQALAQDAPTLLLDEPITGLDLASQQRIVDVIAEETAAGRVVVFSTHHLEEARRSDRVLLLAGRIVADGAPHEVLTTELLRHAYGDRVLASGGAGAIAVDDHGHGTHGQDPHGHGGA
jgi:ABC-type Mn2+/Zn2+ transport system ATPase subunit